MTFKHRRVVAGNDQPGTGGKLSHAVLGAQVRVEIQGGGDVFAADVAGDSRDEPAVRVNAAMCALLLRLKHQECGIITLMYRNPPMPSLLRRVGLSFLMGFSLFALGALVNIVLDFYQVRGFSLYLDDLILGIIAGLLVFAYEQRRHRAMMDKIRVIAAMNHHVRNALQAITYSPYAEQSQRIQLVDESAKRIQWALNEILPGEQEGNQQPLVEYPLTPPDQRGTAGQG